MLLSGCSTIKKTSIYEFESSMITHVWLNHNKKIANNLRFNLKINKLEKLNNHKFTWVYCKGGYWIMINNGDYIKTKDEKLLKYESCVTD